MTRTYHDDALVSAQSLDEYFVTSVERAITKRKVAVRVPEVPVYLAHLLKSFLSTEKSSNAARDERRYHETFALRLKRAIEEDGLEAELHFQRLGDLALWLTGGFPEQFYRARLPVGIRYYMNMGSAAYAHLANHSFQPKLRPIYFELSDKFGAFADVITVATEIEHIDLESPGMIHEITRLLNRYRTTRFEVFTSLLHEAQVVLPTDHKLKN